MKKSARIITIITILISLLGGTLIQSARAESKVIHVKWDAGGSNNGTSWTNAYTDLQSALSAAVDGDEIWIAAGTYKPTTNADRTVSFELKNGVAIYGGFFGNETLRTQHNPATNVTILSGDIGITDDYSDNSYHVVVGNDIDNSAILNGFTITLGNANNFLSNPGTAGGGMLNENSSPTLVNLIFSANIAYGHGGGISNLDNSNPSLTNVIFQNNSAVSGGGMANISSNPTLMNVIFTNNSVTAYGEAYGGGMSNQSSNPILENISFISNTAKQGGGIMNYQSNPTINKVTFSGNSAISGGGMYNWLGSNPTITNSTFSGNSATQGGGGGIFNLSNSYSTIINTTMANNSAFHGGAIYNGNNGSSIIRNSILYANSGVQIYNNNVAANVTYSIVHGGYPGEGNIDADPLINSLQNNGGFTQTMALLPDSPAINAGDDANCPATDQRGVTRPQGSRCDIGAYELESQDASIAVTIGGAPMGTYVLASGEEQREYYNVSGGPVKVESLDTGKKIVSAIRLQSFANNTLHSFVETMGVPSGLLSHKYYFPTYNNTWPPLNSQVRFGNLDAGPTTIRVTIGGVNVWEQVVPGLEERRLTFPVSGGPVVIESLDTGKKIVAAIRLQSYPNGVLYSFSETMGIPDEYISHKYYFPTYNNTWAPLHSQIRFGNLDASPTTVRVTIGGVNVWEQVVPGLAERRLEFPVSGGPVVIESLDTSKKIVAAIRLQSYPGGKLYSFVETMGVPEGLLSHKYFFPTYNNTWAPLNSQVRFGNLDAGPTTIRVTIGGVNVWEQVVPGLDERRLNFPVSGGPVVIESLDTSKKIVAAIRLQSFANNTLYSFSETMGIPEEQMSDVYYFPTYNNTWTPLNSQLRFGVP